MRHRIVGCLARGGPASVRELAAQVERVPEGLYYHVRALVAAGLVEPRGESLRAGRREARYGLAAVRLRTDPASRSRPYRRALGETGAALLRLAAREVRSSVGRSDLALAGATRNFLIRRYQLRMSRPQLATLNARLERLGAWIESHQRLAQGGEDLALAIALVPHPAGPHRHGRAASRRSPRRAR